MRKIMNIKYISMIALTAALVGCSKNGQMDDDIHGRTDLLLDCLEREARCPLQYHRLQS